MNGIISDTKTPPLDKVKEYSVAGVVGAVSGKEVCEYPAAGEEKYRVALIDYGAKKSIIKCLNNRGCSVLAFPHDTPGEKILESAPDGVMLSNGPGDPAENVFEIEQIKKIIGKVPLFGICLGHQLTALAMGGKTVKLKYGHHGANQPVREVNGSRTYITSQNHGYAVVAKTLEGVGEEIFVNANDGSCEGMRYLGVNAFTVQFHPEACGGPHDSEFLFDRFVNMMEENLNG